MTVWQRYDTLQKIEIIGNNMGVKQSITEDYPLSITRVYGQIFNFSGSISRKIFIDNLVAVLIWASYLSWMSYTGYGEITGSYIAGGSLFVLVFSQFDKIYDGSKERLQTTKGFLTVVLMTTLLFGGVPALVGLLKYALPSLPVVTITWTVVLTIALMASFVRRARTLGHSMMFAISSLSIVAIPYVTYVLLKKDK